jgi:hypothetical protein
MQYATRSAFLILTVTACSSELNAERQTWQANDDRPPMAAGANGTNSHRGNGIAEAMSEDTASAAGSGEMLEAYRLSARQRAPRRRHNGSAGAPAPVAAAGSGAGGSVASAAGHTGAAGSQASAGAPAPAGSDGQVGVGDLAHPVQGPAPSDAAKVGGAAFSLVKNWDFGSDGTVRNIDQLSAEFQYHDHWNTIANGNNYGSVIVAPNAATAIGASGLGLPSDMQPVEDPARPYREFTASSIKTYVRPLSSSAASVSVSAHNTGCGSLTAKWQLANGGALLKHDVLWETRARMPVPVAAYWFALWTAGTQWDRGAEMDVLESFGTPNIHVDAFH